MRREGVLPKGLCSTTAGRRRRRVVRLAVALAVACGAWLAMASAPALAALQYPFLGQLAVSSPTQVAVNDFNGINGDTLVVTGQAIAVFDSTGTQIATLDGSNTPAKNFAGNIAVAADNATGDIYVADASNEVVDIFDSSGNYLSQFNGAATPAGSFNSPRGIGVDQATGNVYVSDTFNHVVDVFSSSGTYLSQITGTSTARGSFVFVLSVAVDDATGNVFVADSNPDLVYEFDAAGNLLATWNGANTPAGSFGLGSSDLGVAANDATGSVYVADSADKVVDQFDSTGTYLSQIPGPPNSSFGNPVAVAVSQITGDVYVADSPSNLVDIFGPNQVLLPDVTTAPASSVQPSGATLNGTVNPDGVQVTDCHFDYGTTTAYGLTVPCAQTPAQIGSGSAPVAVSADLSGLTPGVVYHFRLSAANANGTNTGADQIFGPPAVDGESSSNITKTGATLQAQVNPDGVDATCQFQYVDSAHYNASASNPYSAGATAPCTPADLGSGTSDALASADLSGLEAGATYHWRVVAANAAGAVNGVDQTFPTVPAAGIDSVTISNVTATSATVHAQINPLGDDTTYHFEWGTTTAYGNSIPIPDADIGSGSSDVAVSQQLEGLQPNTTYHVRVVATNSVGTAYSPDHTFIYDTTGGGLPDSRAYEMVTPPQKNGALIGEVLQGLLPDVSADGSRVIVTSDQAFAGAGSDPDRQFTGEAYLFARSRAGWLTTPLAPPASQFHTNTNFGVSADAGTALFSIPTPPGGEDDLYAREPGGSFVDIGPATAPADGAQRWAFPGPVAATADLSHVVYEDSTPEHTLWPFDATVSALSTYEYVGAGNSAPVLVGVSGARGSTDLISVCGTRGGGERTAYNALSADGSTVFFTAQPCSSGSGANAGTPVPAEELFARIDESRTVAISTRSPTDCTGTCQTSPPSDAMFEGASSDGSKVFLTSTQQLTDAASQDSSDSARGTGCTQGAGASGCNLYEYDFANPAGHNLIAVSAGDSSGIGPQVQGVMAISPDGSHVYFVAKGVLAANPDGQGQTAAPGAENLYVFERDARFPTGHIAFVAALSPSDDGAWLFGVLGAGLTGDTSNVTPDGRFLVFTSHAQLTPGDTSTAQQVLRYDAQTGELVRVSVGQRGFNDSGNAGLGDATIAGVTFYSHLGPARTDGTMSDDGRRVFFQSPVGLTAHALDDVRIGTDGTGNPIYAQNVYEWEQDGTGSCRQQDGCVFLISDGRDTAQLTNESDVHLFGASTSGADVFFTTSDALVPQDTDTGLDWYDARVCTASDPCVTAPAPATACQGDACQGAPGTPPPAPTAASVTFVGPGNLSPSAPPATVKLLGRVVHGLAFFLRVEVPGGGRITITGAGIRTVRRTVAKAGVYRLRVTLTAKDKRALKHKRKLKLKLRVSYAPASGASSSVTFSITDKA
jgi:DNA-binding beta-propeller fold protein YncE